MLWHGYTTQLIVTILVFVSKRKTEEALTEKGFTQKSRKYSRIQNLNKKLFWL